MPSGDISWESVALVGAVSSMFSGVLAVVLVQIRKLQKQTAEQFEKSRQHLDVQTVKINGGPIAQVDNSEFPSWVKTVDGRVKSISPAYTAYFGKTPQEYVGKRDHQVWPKDVADKFVEHDMLVFRTGTKVRCIELVPGDPRDPDSPREPWVVVKYPIRDELGEITQIGGYAIPEDVIEKTRQLLDSAISIEEAREHQKKEINP